MKNIITHLPAVDRIDSKVVLAKDAAVQFHRLFNRSRRCGLLVEDDVRVARARLRHLAQDGARTALQLHVARAIDRRALDHERAEAHGFNATALSEQVLQHALVLNRRRRDVAHKDRSTETDEVRTAALVGSFPVVRRGGGATALLPAAAAARRLFHIRGGRRWRGRCLSFLRGSWRSCSLRHRRSPELRRTEEIGNF